jgi:hypothetical protein
LNLHAGVASGLDRDLAIQGVRIESNCARRVRERRNLGSAEAHPSGKLVDVGGVLFAVELVAGDVPLDAGSRA